MSGWSGNWSGIRAERGALIEYVSGTSPLALEFEFNPATITRTRSVTVKNREGGAARGGYDFANAGETVRAAQGVSVGAESFSIRILLDATDRMDCGDPVAAQVGIQPELDVIRSMLEPKTQTPQGARTLAALGQGNERAFSRHQFPSVLLFKWGVQVLPVFMIKAQLDVKEYLPTLAPYRAEATLELQLIESRNPFYDAELRRQLSAAALSPGLGRAFTTGG